MSLSIDPQHSAVQEVFICFGVYFACVVNESTVSGETGCRQTATRKLTAGF